MEDGVTVRHDVTNPSGTHRGVRVHNGGRGVWVGMPVDRYDRARCEALARARYKEVVR